MATAKEVSVVTDFFKGRLILTQWDIRSFSECSCSDFAEHAIGACGLVDQQENKAAFSREIPSDDHIERGDE